MVAVSSQSPSGHCFQAPRSFGKGGKAREESERSSLEAYEQERKAGHLLFVAHLLRS